MAKTKINPEAAAAEVASAPAVTPEVMPDAQTVTDMAPVEPTSAAVVRMEDVNVGAMVGEFTSKDMLIPRLEIVQALGPNSEKFPGGTVIFNKVTTLAKFALGPQDKEQPLNIVALFAKKFIEEVLKYDPNGPLPRTFATMEDATKAGLRTGWGPKQADGTDLKPQVREVVSLLVLVQQPEGVDPILFPLECEGKRYALGMWTVRGTAYKKVAKVMFSNMHYALGGNLAKGVWTMVVKRENFDGKLVYVPNIALVGTTPDALRSMASAMVTGKNVQTDNGHDGE